MDRTIDAMGTRLGSDPTLNDVVSELNIAKPTFYRFFDDKSDLFWAIADKVRDDLMARLPSSSQTWPFSSVAELTRVVVSEVVNYADENPAVVRFVVRSQFGHRFELDNRPQSDVSGAAAKIVEALKGRVSKVEVDTAKAEFHLYALLAACGSVCDWWLGTATRNERVMPREQFIDYVVLLVTGLVAQFTEDIGVVHDPHRILSASFTSCNRRGSRD
ncbi:TetR/AcrR family transcriptional regulator [Mycobacteroides abscessus subsp. bolletii]|uniref:TetR/AcrR family transcriptional regulator n=1 Tax=Mycobacteroides abscessus TaxID=36809 RepID=UPI0019D0CD0B|nr:TetR/AcrR family transcriptional regulator [Mycobacteroides abscessus]MBN7303148.1 TetR/AcrR family transcriptional regulator [Mycobacteroides abscessus subsp. bolletii]